MKLNSSQNCSSNGQAAKLEPFAATLIILYIHECNLYDTQLAVTIHVPHWNSCQIRWYKRRLNIMFIHHATRSLEIE